MSSNAHAIDQQISAGDAALETRKPGEAEAFWFWLRLGCISFGGPAGQIAIMHDELVERRRWIGERRFLHALNFCMALPGPEAQQLASYIGYSMYGVRGAITSGGLFVLPSFVLLCAMSSVYVEYGEVAAVAGIVRGLGAAVIALVAAAVIRVGGRVVHTPAAGAMAAVAFALIAVGVPFPVIIVMAALAGYLGGKKNPRLFGKPGGHGTDEADAEDSRPLATGLRRRFIKTLAIWLIPVAVLLLVGGFVAQLTGFFTLAALITFGGAYAVLPFVASAAVNHYGWLTSKDMVAGLALGASTPGPLIMVNTFVGFVAGYNVEGGLVWGFTGATIATLCTFVPSYDSVLADPLLQPLFGAGQPEHVDHLTAFTAESFGGPDRFSRDLGFGHLIAIHRGLRITEQQRQRFVELYMAALDAADMPSDSAFRESVREHVEFGSKVAKQNSHADNDDELHPLREVPRWTWAGDDGAV